MKKEQIKKQIEEIDNQLSEIDGILQAVDESSVKDVLEKEAELMKKKYTLIQEYEQLISY